MPEGIGRLNLRVQQTFEVARTDEGLEFSDGAPGCGQFNVFDGSPCGWAGGELDFDRGFSGAATHGRAEESEKQEFCEKHHDGSFSLRSLYSEVGGRFKMHSVWHGENETMRKRDKGT
jgi:hypothetical protein